MFKIIALALLLIAVGPLAVASEVQKAQYQQLYQEAEAARQKAAEAGYEWRDTAKMLELSQKAAANGDYTVAIELADDAKMQGELAYQQSQQQAEAWQDFVIE